MTVEAVGRALSIWIPNKDTKPHTRREEKPGGEVGGCQGELCRLHDSATCSAEISDVCNSEDHGKASFSAITIMSVLPRFAY